MEPSVKKKIDIKQKIVFIILSVRRTYIAEIHDFSTSHLSSIVFFSKYNNYFCFDLKLPAVLCFSNLYTSQFLQVVYNRFFPFLQLFLNYYLIYVNKNIIFDIKLNKCSKRFFLNSCLRGSGH